MRSSPTCKRRSSGLVVSTALLLAGAPGYGHARNLRRSSSSSFNTVEVDGFEVVSSNDRQYLEDESGFEVVGGTTYHEPMSNPETIVWHRSMLQEEEVDEEGDSSVPKEYINDETLSFVDPNKAEHNRIEKSCGSDEMLWSLKFRTDNYGYETSWQLEKRLRDNVWTKVTSGPPGDSKYHDNTLYRGALCLQGANMYKLTIMDARSDGLCCNYGKGTYSYEINGVTEFDSEQKTTFSEKAQHTFYVGLPVPANNGNGNSGANQNKPIFQGKSSSCGQNKQKIGIKFIGDNYAGENSWELRSLSTNTVIKQKGVGSFRPNASDMTEICIDYGKYQFTLKDGVGDGICCGTQGDGRYEIYMDDERIIYGSDFTYGKEVKHIINAGYFRKLNQLTQREIQYLNCHNWRRKKYHEEYGATYVPLKYDLSLQDDAQHWADELLNECHIDGIKHEPGVEQGENLAKNMGSPQSDFGKLYPVENICRRWFEREVGWRYPDNAHLTQGLWRSAHYVGCAESTKTMKNGGQCHIQVCRYARAGNCNMGKYESTKGENWKVPLLKDHNPCGPVCPPTGCH